MNKARQQYLSNPKSSKRSLTFSPFSRLSLNSSHKWPTGLLQEKQRTGIIIRKERKEAYINVTEKKKEEKKMKAEDIKKKIEEHLNGAEVNINDPRKDGIHLEATIKYKGFKGKTLLEQHRMIYNILKQELQTEELHALAIKTEL